MTDRIPSLDGLRALSITAVLFAHFSTRLDMYGQYGVTIFFIISGYLITGLMMKERDRTGSVNLRDFYIRRAFRILPVAYLFLTIMTLLFLRGTPRYQIVMSWLYLTHYIKVPSWNIAHLWSLSVEEQFYLLWPLIFVLYNPKRFAWAAIIVAPILRIVLAIIGHHVAPTWWFPTIFSFPAIFDSIATGCLLAIYEARLASHLIVSSKATWALWMVVAAIPVVQLHTHGLTYASLMVFFNLAAAICILNAVYTRPWIFNNHFAVWVGVLSYSLYIWQMPYANKAYHIAWPVGLLGAFASAVASYYLVEKPILTLRKKLFVARIGAAVYG